MALGADGIAPVRVEPGGIHHARVGRIADVLAARTVAALASHAVIGEWRLGVSILRPAHIPNLTGMAPEAAVLYRSVETNFAVLLITGRGVPRCGVDEPAHRQLEKVTLPPEQVGAPVGVRPEEIV